MKRLALRFGQSAPSSSQSGNAGSGVVARGAVVALMTRAARLE